MKNKNLGNVNLGAIAQFLAKFDKEATEKALAEVAQQKAERDAMPKNKQWLVEEIYNHVCWHEGGSGIAMCYYLDEIEKRWRPDMSVADVIALKEDLLGY